jgi:2-polyprenyl-6-hydroxyphenyl methylase/3-demethylubiquinone-9 3-methyltransferase
VAKPEQVFAFMRERGFELRYLKTCAGGLGCNEYVFERGDGSGAPADR